jgi:hypothetical protein
MLQQIQIKYMTALRQGTELRLEDLGAVRLAMRMALEELHLQYRHDLADMDDVVADLLEQRDQFKAAAGTDAGEILRLQTMEDRLVAWVNEHEPVNEFEDVADIVIDLLTKYRASGATLVPAARTIPVETITLNANGNGNGHVQITDLGTRYAGRRLNIDNEQLREFAIAKIQLLAMRLGHTPTQSDWGKHMQPDEPSLTSVKNRLGKGWNDLVADAGLAPNLSSHQRAAQIAAAQETEARTDDAEATFRSE